MTDKKHKEFTISERIKLSIFSLYMINMILITGVSLALITCLVLYAPQLTTSTFYTES